MTRTLSIAPETRPPLHADPPGDWLSIFDLSKMLRLTHQKLEKMKAAGELPPHVEFSKRAHRWHRQDVEAWAAEKREQARRVARSNP